MSENVRSAEKLSRKQETFVVAYLSLPTLAAAARAAGVTEKTARIWTKQPLIEEAIRRARKEFYSTSMQSMISLVDDAIGVLRTVLQDKEASYGIKLRAAQLVLEHTRATFIDEDIDARVSALEDEMHYGD